MILICQGDGYSICWDENYRRFVSIDESGEHELSISRIGWFDLTEDELDAIAKFIYWMRTPNDD